jgi:hypothetical protein
VYSDLRMNEKAKVDAGKAAELKKKERDKSGK